MNPEYDVVVIGAGLVLLELIKEALISSGIDVSQ